ncbi:MAG TPA: transporter substrate-binding domain-containing protein [Thermoanaerobaculia bacterium]|nr:transporter substrate-binding domain-containing protein [Thermoanaerobaculia bacterium]
MSITKQRLSLQSPARPLRGLPAVALFLSLASLPVAASAIEIKNVKGDGTCPADWVLLSAAEAKANQAAACRVLGQWDIARLAAGGSMDGPGYNCQIRSSDKRTLGNSLCIKPETLETGKLKVCMYPGFLPFVGMNKIQEWIGWDVTYLQGFAGQQNLRFVPVNIPDFNNIWTLPGNNTCDIAASGISDLPARRQQTGTTGDWSDHYYSVYRSFAVRSADDGKLKEVADLKGKTAIVTLKSTADLDLTNRLACAKIPECENHHVTPSCVDVLRTNNEEESAKKVLDGSAFAYGGGLGSIQYLARTLGGLAVAWPHCNTEIVQNDCKPVDEPFSFVVRHASAGLLEALNEYIANQNYPGKVPTGLTCR